MDTGQINAQIKLLTDILNKKFEILKEILSITENQGIVLKSSPNERELFMNMFDEKQNRIDNISAGDDVFNKIFTPVIEQIKYNKVSYKSYIASMQKLVKAIMDIEIRIKLEERNNLKYMQNIINTVPMSMATKQYSRQKQKLKDIIKQKPY